MYTEKGKLDKAESNLALAESIEQVLNLHGIGLDFITDANIENSLFIRPNQMLEEI